MGFPHIKQSNNVDCGPTCLQIICKYYKRDITINEIKNNSYSGKGYTFQELKGFATLANFDVAGFKANLNDFKEKVPLPCIVHFNNNHFVVVYKVTKSSVYISDPASGKMKLTNQEFSKLWLKDDLHGMLLALSPNQQFDQEKDLFEKEDKNLFLKEIKYHFSKELRTYLRVIISIFVAGFFQLLMPLLTQSIVDIGLKNRNIDFIYMILAAQMFLFLGRIIIEFIQSWLVILIGGRINVNLISKFIGKVMNLPLSKLHKNRSGDLLVKISDHGKIERLVTSNGFTFFYSVITFLGLMLILIFYNITVFIIFISFALAYILWITLFLKKRKKLDFIRFSEQSNIQNLLIDMLEGIKDLSMFNVQKVKQKLYEDHLLKLFELRKNYLKVEQMQGMGARLINEVKNILILIYSSSLVLDGELTLGMLLAISFIVGQLNSPLNSFIGFVLAFQDSKLAIDRIEEIYYDSKSQDDISNLSNIKSFESFELKNVFFKYNGLDTWTLKNISFKIHKGDKVAIVGQSGSGKSSLIKIILGYLVPDQGSYYVNDIPFEYLNIESWKSLCAGVLQESHVFQDTIKNNISLNHLEPVQSKLYQSIEDAQLLELVESLPRGIETEIQSRDTNLSGGQMQRILIARALYHNPDLLILDEATGSLDIKTENLITSRLIKLFESKTMLIISHRLNTIKNCDKIIVLKDGEIVSIGAHKELLLACSTYNDIMGTQLEYEQTITGY